GMVQRLGLAQAVLHDPPLLILDEPMSGLDPIGRKDTRDLLVDLRRRGKTLFFSTHILNDVETICDRVGMVLKGRLVAEGTLDALLDGSVKSVELRCAGLAEESFAPIRSLALDAGRGPDGWTFSFADLAGANHAAGRVLALGGRILSLSPVRETLEQSFMRLATASGPADGVRRQASSG
ncbi:MAG TPA: ABC transporter ATP-binding protein, partial [Anaeromyxobacter sp.]